MSRSLVYRAATKPTDAAADGTVFFSGNDLPQSRPGASVVALLLEFSGTATDPNTDDIVRIRVKTDGATLYDVSLLALRSLLDAFGQTGHAWGTADETGFVIPLNLFSEAAPDLQDLVAFPLGENLSLELDLSATTPTTNGTVAVSAVLSDVEPRAFPVLRSNPMNITGAATGAAIDLNERGAVVAFSVNRRATNGPARHKLVLEGQTVFEGSAQQIYNYARLVSRNDPTLTATDGATLWIPIQNPKRATKGVSFYEVDSGSANVAADEYALWSVRDFAAG